MRGYQNPEKLLPLSNIMWWEGMGGKTQEGYLVIFMCFVWMKRYWLCDRQTKSFHANCETVPPHRSHLSHGIQVAHGHLKWAVLHNQSSDAGESVRVHTCGCEKTTDILSVLINTQWLCRRWKCQAEKAHPWRQKRLLIWLSEARGKSLPSTVSFIKLTSSLLWKKKHYSNFDTNASTTTPAGRAGG